MIDIEKWHHAWQNETYSLVEDLLSRFEMNEQLSLLDLAPDLKMPIHGRTYGLWRPPNDSETALEHPVTNLPSLLTTEPAPQVIVAPLSPRKTLTDFKETYGLGNGINYEEFIDLIKQGRIILMLTTSQEHYKEGFYQDIFHACMNCELSSYLPPYPEAIFGALMENINSRSFEERYSGDAILEKVSQLFKANDTKELSSEYPFIDPNRFKNITATRAHLLSISGLHKLVDLSFILFGKSPLLGYESLGGYQRYLLSGFPNLGCTQFYENSDIGNMAFLRLLEKEKMNALKEHVEVSPADFIVVSRPFEALFLPNPDTDDVKDALKRGPDDEVSRASLEVQTSFQQLKFENFYEKSKKVAEVVSERINDETKRHYRHSRIIKGSIQLGGAIIVDMGLNALSLQVPLSTLITCGLYQQPILLGEHLNKIGKFLSKKWIFREKGIPSYFWHYDIIPEDLQKS